MHRQKLTRHEQVDPYYISREEGHLYLVGYSHNPLNPWMNKFLEFRIDRIQADSLKRLPDTIDVQRRRKPIEFHRLPHGAKKPSSLLTIS